MPKWFHPTTLLCGALFAISPFVIANAPYESTMGLVQKVFYYHMPSAWVFLLAAIICGVASVRFLARGDARQDRLAWAAAELVVLFGAIVRPLGVALSTVILIVAASAASSEFRPRESLVAGLLLATLAVGVFVIGLQLQLPIWPLQP